MIPHPVEPTDGNDLMKLSSSSEPTKMPWFLILYYYDGPDPTDLTVRVRSENIETKFEGTREWIAETRAGFHEALDHWIDGCWSVVDKCPTPTNGDGKP